MILTDASIPIPILVLKRSFGLFWIFYKNSEAKIMIFVRKNDIKIIFFKRGRKNRNQTLFTCLSTHVWGFFWRVCEWRKTFEGRYFSCLNVKEPKKFIVVPWFHQITPKKRGRKSKKIGIRPFFMFKYPCLGFFSVGVRVA